MWEGPKRQRAGALLWDGCQGGARGFCFLLVFDDHHPGERSGAEREPAR